MSIQLRIHLSRVLCQPYGVFFSFGLKSEQPKSQERRHGNFQGEATMSHTAKGKSSAEPHEEGCKEEVQKFCLQEQLSFLVAPGLNWIWEKNWMLQACHLQFYWIFYRDYWIFCNHPLDWQIKDTLIKLLEMQSCVQLFALWKREMGM